MKLATLAVVAVAAVATVSAADQPSLRTANTPVEAAPAAVKTPVGNEKKEQCGGWGELKSTNKQGYRRLKL
ncbi:hypothetical protein PF008_g19873 [Phytophthora fragariae]|uniref:RxLR effector protein n=1 Tax=Phytophthora fragariae TaxID=53985 RepID=A0A6G0R1D6_9STRA|nr:hypothetical protein PF008_g19873 [Phytophthora fragariae]